MMKFPGFIDVHVHFRDPGMTEAETCASGVAAAIKGGFAAVVTMPNTTPACDSVELIRYQASFSTSKLAIIPSACVTKGRLGREVADIEELAKAGAAFFTDDGSYVADAKVMEAAMRRIAALDMVLSQHAMDPVLTGNGVIRSSPLAKKMNLPVIPASAEIQAVRRDISLCRETGCRLHIQHISTAEGVQLVREAQKEGLPVTAEATPHHLLFSCEDIQSDDASFKMAPPLGNHEDRAELRKAVKDGVLMFATDHAPHPYSKKSLGFLQSANGIVGLEVAVPVTWTVMVEEEGMSPDAWARAWRDMPLSLFPSLIAEKIQSLGIMTELDVDEVRKVNVNEFHSLSRNCPYDGLEFKCWPKEVQ
jgi:dihydroorotase